MNLNKKDLHCYYQFLNKIKLGFNNDILDNNINEVNNFILHKYNSYDFQTITLEDFIQECLILILEKEKNVTFCFFNQLYCKLKRKDNQISKEIDSDYYDIDYNSIYFDMFINDFISKMSISDDKKILSTIINNNDLRIDNNNFNLSKPQLAKLKKKLFQRLKYDNNFKEYYADYIDSYKRYYNKQLSFFSLKEYFYKNKHFYGKYIVDLMIKYIDNFNLLTKDELLRVEEVLLHIREDYFIYHKEEIVDQICKIRKSIFDKTVRG